MADVTHTTEPASRKWTRILAGITPRIRRRCTCETTWTSNKTAGFHRGRDPDCPRHGGC